MDPFIELTTPTMSQDEKKFFAELGTRVADLRKELGLTQQQLADALGTTQQQVASYEVARLRIPASMLPRLARVLGVTLETLIGDEHRPAAKRGPAPKLQQQIERIQQLPRSQQKFVMQMLDTVLAQQSR